MSKPLRKAIMGRSDLESKYLNNRNSENKRVYREQKNIVADSIKRKKNVLGSK